MKKFLTLEQLRLELKKHNVNSRKQYHKQRKPDWPSNPNIYYKNWISYNNLFGKPEKIKVNYLTLDQLKKELKKHNVNNRIQYRKQRKPNWPSNPHQSYKNWISWNNLFGKPVVNYLTLEQLKKELKKHNVNSFKQYHKQRKPDWPSSPKNCYKNWISWTNLFGKPEKIAVNHLTLEQLKKEVKKYNVNSKTQYRKQRKPNWPSDPNRFYKNWISWNDLFGKPEKISLEQLKLEVKKHNVNSILQYLEQRKPDWPSAPDKYYKNWISWNNLFGKNINIRNFVIKRLKAS